MCDRSGSRAVSAGLALRAAARSGPLGAKTGADEEASRGE